MRSIFGDVRHSLFWPYMPYIIWQEQARGCLHLHFILFTGKLNPASIEAAMSNPDALKAISARLDSMVQAKLPQNVVELLAASLRNEVHAKALREGRSPYWPTDSSQVGQRAKAAIAHGWATQSCARTVPVKLPLNLFTRLPRQSTVVVSFVVSVVAVTAVVLALVVALLVVLLTLVLTLMMTLVMVSLIMTVLALVVALVVVLLTLVLTLMMTLVMVSLIMTVLALVMVALVLVSLVVVSLTLMMTLVMVSLIMTVLTLVALPLVVVLLTLVLTLVVVVALAAAFLTARVKCVLVPAIERNRTWSYYMCRPFYPMLNQEPLTRCTSRSWSCQSISIVTLHRVIKATMANTSVE